MGVRGCEGDFQAWSLFMSVMESKDRMGWRYA